MDVKGKWCRWNTKLQLLVARNPPKSESVPTTKTNNVRKIIVDVLNGTFDRFMTADYLDLLNQMVY